MHLFFQPDPKVFELDEEESRHCTKVLRLTSGDIIYITNGKGLLQKCRLNIGKRNVTYEEVESSVVPKRSYGVHMAIAPTRKAERNEWMVEKMTEMGVERIDFIVTEHTHKETVSRVVNLSRLNRIAASAMKQSQQYYIPEIRLISSFNSFIKENSEGTRLIAYVPDNHLTEHVFKKVVKDSNTVLLIGPEGDFSPEEFAIATANGFEAVSLGATRLRTETAAVAGCHAINLAQFV
jgi:16S rRNA (uracil1498-N3)-methyltransferase